MSTQLQPELLRLYRALPERRLGEDIARWEARWQKALASFGARVTERYLEGTLLRLLYSTPHQLRQAAVLALGLTGTMAANDDLAIRLHDDDRLVQQLAADAMWSIWFRAAAPEHSEELRRLSELLGAREAGAAEILARFARLLQQAPGFAEAYNQRAIFAFQRGFWREAIADCQKVLELNPHHFGAAAGMGRCHMKLREHDAALRAYRKAHAIHPSLPGVRQTIKKLERMLGEQEK